MAVVLPLALLLRVLLPQERVLPRRVLPELLVPGPVAVVLALVQGLVLLRERVPPLVELLPGLPQDRELPRRVLPPGLVLLRVLPVAVVLLPVAVVLPRRGLPRRVLRPGLLQPVPLPELVRALRPAAVVSRVLRPGLPALHLEGLLSF